MRKNIDEVYIIRSELWLEINYNERVADYEPLPSGEYVIKYKSDPGVDIKKVEKNKALPLGPLVPSHS